MTSSTQNPNQFVYDSIKGIPSYIDFEFTVNFATILVVLMLIYHIPCYAVLIRLIVFSCTNRKLDAIFHAFVIMQVVMSLHGIADFFISRLPGTGLATSWIARSDPQIPLKLAVLFYYTTLYFSQILTVLFCIMRVIILYCSAHVKEAFESWFKVISLITFILSVSAAFPQFLSGAIGFQLNGLYPFGALVIISNFHLQHSYLLNFFHALFTLSVIIAVIITTFLIFRKIFERRRLRIATHSAYNSKAEKTLSFTVVLILIPYVMREMVSISTMYRFKVVSYLLLFRPFITDMRIHIVTLYFVFTHPAFKRTTSVSANFSLSSPKFAVRD
ncbi:unnamed protein product [Caenorhabditis sp. 36 PRJEB53466]|nr:unnamed protein product [Caenorhabditis sp. 36 PRJEB53466]